jgi:hypothetical protein
MSEVKNGSLEGILALTGSMSAITLNSLNQYWLFEKAGIYAKIYADACTNEAGLWEMHKYTGLNLPVALCAMTGGFVIGRYIGAWLDKKRNKS